MTDNKGNKTFDKVYSYFNENFDWERYSRLITLVAKNQSLNLGGWKFVKSDVQSLGMEIIVDDMNIFEYIDKQGVDFSFLKKECIEDKSQINLFHNNHLCKDGTYTIKESVSLQMTNTRGDSVPSKQQYLDKLKCEVLLLRQTKEDPRYQWVGLVDVSTLTIENVIKTNDQMKLDIPLEQIHFVYKGTQKQVDVVEINFVEAIQNLMRERLKELI